METVLQIIVGVIAVVVIAVAAVLFGVPGWVPGDRKPDKEVMTIVAVIFGLIVFVIIVAVTWETIAK